jgi:hypothetical protein
MADSQGFEPWIGYKPMPVFKTGAFNRSANCPLCKILAIDLSKRVLTSLRGDVNYLYSFS